MANIKGRLKNDAQTGRLLIIDANNPPEITAEEFLSYIHEGFVPVIKESADNGAAFSIGSFRVGADGLIRVTGGPSPLIIFYPEGVDPSDGPSDDSAPA